MKMMVMDWAERKFLFPLKKVIKDGISIERLSVSLALGVTVGLIPIYGITTLLVGAMAFSLRLNFIAMQIAHYIVHPIQIALLVPFLKMGDSIVKSSEVSFSLQQYIELFKNDFSGTLREFWLVNLSAVGIWLVLSVPFFIILYYLLIRAIRHYLPRIGFLRA
jgi:uncharacterized protein (DUF2062 family)